MPPVSLRVLTVNAGSSSIKFALFEVSAALRRVFTGEVERIGLPGATFRVVGSAPKDNFSRPLTATGQAAAATVLIDWLAERTQSEPVTVVGHRVVHGGPSFSEPQRITAAVVAQLRQLVPLDPEHLPEELRLSEAFRQRFPDLPQIACFDTAFHHDLPPVARLLPIPRRYQALGVRRYGFHGLSYTYLLGELARLAGVEAARGRVILAHLGNGASLAAVLDGHCIDTTMSLTPSGGMPMGTRSGDLDPSLAWYLARTDSLAAERFNEMINFRSGLLGMSETSPDMRDLLAREPHDVRAAEAVSMFCYQLKKWVGAYAASLGGLDTLVFAGGIGEHAPAVRARACEGLAFLGIELDGARNATSEPVISANTSRVVVRVIHTDEEQVIAEAACRVLGLGPVRSVEQ